MTDQRVREGLEQVSNHISRRKFLDTAVHGVFAGLVALVVGARMPLPPSRVSPQVICYWWGDLCDLPNRCESCGGIRRQTLVCSEARWCLTCDVQGQNCQSTCECKGYWYWWGSCGNCATMPQQ